MKLSLATNYGIKKSFVGFLLLLSATALFSFEVGKKARNATLAGVWMTGEITNPNTSHMKVFNTDGTYYEIHFDNGQTIMSHKGTYKILDGEYYQEKVTNTRFNGPWNLKGKTFTNRYEMSKDQQQLVLSGVVYAKNGGDSLKWSHVYKRVQIPE